MLLLALVCFFRHYSVETPAGKAACKAALQKELGLQVCAHTEPCCVLLLVHANDTNEQNVMPRHESFACRYACIHSLKCGTGHTDKINTRTSKLCVKLKACMAWSSALLLGRYLMLASDSAGWSSSMKLESLSSHMHLCMNTYVCTHACILSIGTSSARVWAFDGKWRVCVWWACRCARMCLWSASSADLHTRKVSTWSRKSSLGKQSGIVCVHLCMPASSGVLVLLPHGNGVHGWWLFRMLMTRSSLWKCLWYLILRRLEYILLCLDLPLLCVDFPLLVCLGKLCASMYCRVVSFEWKMKFLQFQYYIHIYT